MRNTFRLLALLLLPHVALAAPDTPEITNIYLDRPLWATGMGDASWLLKKEQVEKAPTFAFFSFSSQKTNMPDKPIEQREDNSGRTTRSLPIYLAERINVETNCRAENHIFVVKNSGPVVSGKEWDVETLLGLFKSTPPDFFVSGHIVHDYLDLRSTITLRIWDVKGKRELTNISESQMFTEPVDVASELPSRFLESVKKSGLCKFSNPERYPAPPSNLIGPYLDALGQLLIQTLAANGMVERSSIWGEEDMLNWYRTLQKNMPLSDAPKLMFIRGVLSSIKYGGIARDMFLAALIHELEVSRTDDVFFKLSPLVYAKINDAVKCEARKATIRKTATGAYLEWLEKVDCQAYNNAFNSDLRVAARPLAG